MSTNTMSELEVWTAKDVARFLKMHEQSVYRMTKEKRIPYFKIGHTVRFVKQAILQLASTGGAV